MGQLRTWWGDEIDSCVFHQVITMSLQYMENDEETVQLVRTVKEVFRKHLDDGMELGKLVDQYLVPQALEKKMHSEVSSPYALRQGMLDKIPAEFWTVRRRVLEPCAGKGGFLVDIVARFMHGLRHEIPDESERRRVIVEECLFWADINATNVFVCRLLLDPHSQYKLNGYKGDTMELDVMSEWTVDGFDAVIGNPPFENNTNDKRMALNHNLWSVFLQWAYAHISEEGFLLFITPTSWMSPTSKTKDIFYNNHVLYLNLNECKKHFKVGSTFSYYLIQKTTRVGTTVVDCEYKKKQYSSICDLRDREYLPNFTTNVTLGIIDKFMTNEVEKVSFRTSCELHNTTHKNKLQDVSSDTFVYPVRHTIKRNTRYSSTPHSMQYKNKILMNLSGNLTPIYDEGVVGFTQAQLYLLTSSSQYVHILKSKLYMFVFKICKWSGFNIERVFHSIPFIAEVTSDAEIYKLFQLTTEEVDMIEANV